MSPPPPALHAALHFEGEEVTVRLGGEIDLLTAPRLAAVFDAISGQSRGRVILDLADVGFMGADGFNLIATLATRFRGGNGRVVVRSASTLTRRLLDLLDLGALVENGSPALHVAEEASGATDGAVVRSLDEMRLTSVQRRERTIDAALGVIVAWAAAAITGADGVSVTLDRRNRLSTVASSDDTAARLDGGQYAVGQGPCVHASTHGEAALVSSVAGDSRWPEFLPQALDDGMAAILSTPLTIGSRPVGALNVYSRTEEAFGPAEQEISGLIATQAAGILTGGSDDLTAPDHLGRLQDALRVRELIAQAQGVLIHREAIDAEAAAAHLQRESRRAEIPLGQLAAQLVAQTTSATDPSSHA